MLISYFRSVIREYWKSFESNLLNRLQAELVIILWTFPVSDDLLKPESFSFVKQTSILRDTIRANYLAIGNYENLITSTIYDDSFNRYLLGQVFFLQNNSIANHQWADDNDKIAFCKLIKKLFDWLLLLCICCEIFF